MIRKFKRDQLKKAMGTNKISEQWAKMQVAKYGYKNWAYMRIKCDGTRNLKLGEV